MEAKKFVKKLMEEQNQNPSSLSRKTGISRQTLYSFMKTENGSQILFSSLQKILIALGYRLVAVPNVWRLPNGSVDITADE